MRANLVLESLCPGAFGVLSTATATPKRPRSRRPRVHDLSVLALEHSQGRHSERKKEREKKSLALSERGCSLRVVVTPKRHFDATFGTHRTGRNTSYDTCSWSTARPHAPLVHTFCAHAMGLGSMASASAPAPSGADGASSACPLQLELERDTTTHHPHRPTAYSRGQHTNATAGRLPASTDTSRVRPSRLSVRHGTRPYARRARMGEQSAA